MENKYFIPYIEDFHVGYEFQRFVPRENATEEECWQTIKLSVNYLTLDEIDDEIIEKEIRVPYLTKEQIEAEGWKYYQNIPDAVVSEGYVEYYKDVEWFKVVISISETSHYLTVEKVFQNVQIGNELQEFRNTIYNGECKDINTFRKICKLLGI